MITVMAISGAELGAWVAALAGAAALVNQAIQALRKQKKEREQIEEALDRTPEVKQQLELGNVGEAVKHLNLIIETQANHIRTQGERQAACDVEVKDLKDRNDAIEAEAEGWQRRYQEEVRSRQADKIDSDRKIAAVQAEMEELKRTFARSLSQARQQIANQTQEGESA